MSAPIVFTITKVLDMPTAQVTGTLASGSPPAGGSSSISIIETPAGGTPLAPAVYTVASPTNSFSFTAGVGSTLVATQTDTNAAGIAGPPTVNPPFPVSNPAPPAPGLITFAVTSVTQ
jgi:hypothetical protein